MSIGDSSSTSRHGSRVVDVVLWASVAAVVFWTFRYRLLQAPSLAVGYDDGVYWQTGLALGDGASAYDQVFHSQPPLFAWLLGVPFRWADGPADDIAAARLLMTAFAVLLVVVSAGIATTLRGRRAGMLAALGVTAVPVVQKYGFQLGADIPAAALGGAALWCALCARQVVPSRRRWLWLAVGVFVALAALTKLIAVVVVPAVLIALLTATDVDGRAWWRRKTAVAGWSALGFGFTAAVLFVALHPAREAWFQVFGFHLGASVPEASAGPVELMTLAGPWCPRLFIAAAVATVIGLVRSELTDRAAVLAVAAWAAAVLPFALLYQPTFVHHLVWFLAPCVVLVAVALVDLAAALPRVGTIVAVVAVAVACVSVVRSTLDDTFRPAPSAPAMTACLNSLTDGITIVGDDQELLARAGLRTPPWLVDTSLVRLDTGDLTDADLISAAKASAGVLLAREPRLRGRSHFVAWLDRNLPARYAADGYVLHLKRPASGCSQS